MPRMCYVFFFFSSRRRHTRFDCDWSSDVCSSDLFYKVVGATNGDYVLVLSGGPGEDIHSMQGIADELGKKYRCIMWRSEEHTSELQSQSHLVCRLLLEKKKRLNATACQRQRQAHS